MNILTEDAHINEQGGRYAGLTREEAREKIVADLAAGGYLERTEPHRHNVGTCYRCATVVEPRVSFQWFVSMKPLAEPAIAAVANKETRFVPERFEKIYFNWMENIRDWCISRQLWWGHRIPAYYCQTCGHIAVAREQPLCCPACGGPDLRQDEDTLDTGFLRPCGRFQPWAGRMRRRITSIFTRPAYWLPAMTLFFSGLPA
jgi:valyl-tRNA synthetase